MLYWPDIISSIQCHMLYVLTWYHIFYIFAYVVLSGYHIFYKLPYAVLSLISYLLYITTCHIPVHSTITLLTHPTYTPHNMNHPYLCTLPIDTIFAIWLPSRFSKLVSEVYLYNMEVGVVWVLAPPTPDLSQCTHHTVPLYALIHRRVRLGVLSRCAILNNAVCQLGDGLYSGLWKSF